MYSDKIITVKKCTPDDIDEILSLQRDVIEGLDNKALLRENTKELLSECLLPPNAAFGLFDKDILVGLGVFVDAKGTDEDLSIGLSLHTVKRSANMKLILVKKEYRGLGFQKKLMGIIEAYAKEKGYTALILTVSPDNIYSLRNIKEMGYVFDHTAHKYNNLIRDIYVKQL